METDIAKFISFHVKVFPLTDISVSVNVNHTVPMRTIHINPLRHESTARLSAL